MREITYKEARGLLPKRGRWRYSSYEDEETYMLGEYSLDVLPKAHPRYDYTYYLDKIRTKEYIPPIFISMGYMSPYGDLIRFHYGILICDGNHRMQAHRDMGKTHIKGCMPLSHYRLFTEDFKKWLCQQSS